MVRLGPGGELQRLQETEDTFRMSSYRLYAVLEAVSHAHGLGRDKQDVWPWFFRGYEYRPDQRPKAQHCFQPKAVLQSLQELERDVARFKKKLPSRWEFSWVGLEGKVQSAETLVAVYRGRNCVLFGDDDGPWAKETDSGPRQGVHHPLKELPQVAVQLPVMEGETIVSYRRVLPFAEELSEFARFKQLCAQAIEERALLLTSAG
jgi:hypothetical protein